MPRNADYSIIKKLKFMPDDNRDYEDNDPGPCEACGGALEPEKVNLEDYQGGKLYMMEGIPAYVCRDCGETWVPEPVMNEFEKMIDAAKTAKKKTRRSPSTSLGTGRKK